MSNYGYYYSRGYGNEMVINTTAHCDRLVVTVSESLDKAATIIIPYDEIVILIKALEKIKIKIYESNS